MDTVISSGSRSLLARPRLLSRLELALEQNAPTVAVWATAGAGKSALFECWRAELEQRELPVAIIDAAHVSAASLETVVTAFLDEAGDDAPHVMIDDVHALADSADREWLAGFGLRRDPGVSLYLAGRYPPPALAPLGYGGSVIEIRSDALAFTRDEAESLFALRQIGLSESQLDAVYIKTEGWAVALSLLADGLSGAAEVDQLIAEFASDQRGIADYLVSNVLTAQAPEIEQFLLQTCVVDDLSVPLAAHLTGRADAGEVLMMLDEENSLIHRVGSVDPVYRSHAMLSAYLRAMLRRQDLPGSRELHLSAALWYDGHGDYHRALAHTVESDSPCDIVGALDRHGPNLVFNGQAYLVLKALDRVERAGELTAGCHVLAALVTAPYFTDGGRADYHLQLALASREQLSVSARVLLAALVMMRSTAAPDAEATARAGIALDDALDAAAATAGEEWLDAALFAEAARGWVAFQGHGGDAALDLLKFAAEDARRSGRSWLYLLLLDIAASAAARRGRWVETHELQSAMAVAVRSEGRPHDLVSARVQFAVAAAAYEEGEPFALARMADIIAADTLAIDAGLSVPANVLRILLRIDDEPNPRKLYEELDRLMQANAASSRRTLAAVCFRYLDLTIRLRGRAQAKSIETFIAEYLGSDSLEAHLAQFMLAQGTSSQAPEERALVALLEGQFRAWNPSNIVLAWLLLAQLAESTGRDAAADARLEEALEVARPMNARRPFLAARGMGGALLASRVGRLGVSEEFAASVLDLYRAQHPALESIELGSMVFTAKEHEILRELPRHQSVGEIALKQRLSPNTIKTHLRAIYQKLGVNGRTEAVEKAIAAGLL